MRFPSIRTKWKGYTAGLGAGGLAAVVAIDPMAASSDDDQPPLDPICRDLGPRGRISRGSGGSRATGAAASAAARAAGHTGASAADHPGACRPSTCGQGCQLEPEQELVRELELELVEHLQLEPEQQLVQQLVERRRLILGVPFPPIHRVLVQTRGQGRHRRACPGRGRAACLVPPAARR